ncbi:helix-turn-helix domain-containing protein [Actinomycetospora sp. CA-101289]|uniref:helix-turn-helix domain-containing protein n=1 Tax=Actinomycetospora sp. CA-101289 TaxID=3239893 RepID=UPI003D97B382
MDPVTEWTGRLAHALRRAMRMSNPTFAEKLGVHARTVDMWRANSERRPNPEIQQALDTMLERADETSRKRFELIAGAESPTATPPVESLPDEPPQNATVSGPVPTHPTISPGAGSDFLDWLRISRTVSAPPDGSDLGEILKWHRKRQDLTQKEAAEFLNTHQSTLSRIENGTQQLTDVNELRHFARALGIPPSQLGVLMDRSGDAIPDPTHVSHLPGPVKDSQDHWRLVRRELNANRALLGHMAADLYSSDNILAGTAVLAGRGWVPPSPVMIDEITMTWSDIAPPPSITGGSPETARTLPLAADGQVYSRYSRALRDLAKPRLLDNRVSYRLIDVGQWARPSLEFTYTSYFETLDVGEPLGHEFAQAWMDAGRGMPRMADLPLRQSISDPFDLWARPMLPSINTLTIRRDPVGGHRFYMHLRDSSSVASGGGILHVSPAGAFQPAAIAPVHQRNDFSLWRNMQREYAEEFLGQAEHDGNSTDPIHYETDEPFASFERARLSGDFRVYVCAVVLEPLTLWVELITIAVISAPAFDELFGDMVLVNDEGAFASAEERPTSGIPFTADSMKRLETAQLSPIARACIYQAWSRRHELLSA